MGGAVRVVCQIAFVGQIVTINCYGNWFRGEGLIFNAIMEQWERQILEAARLEESS